MDVYYEVCIENDEGIHACRFTVREMRWILVNAPIDPELGVSTVHALASLAHEPIADTTVRELSIFFTVLSQLWLDSQTSDSYGGWLSLNGEVFVMAVVRMATIPDNVQLSTCNQYSYFSDYRHPEKLRDRWKAIKAVYLAQNPHMARPDGQARRIYEIRRQMAHELGWVDKDIYHNFERPPRMSEDFRPVLRHPVWEMPFMVHPEMELPMPPRFRDVRAISASTSRLQSTSELPSTRRAAGPRSQPDRESSGPGAQSPVISDCGGSNVADAGLE